MKVISSLKQLNRRRNIEIKKLKEKYKLWLMRHFYRSKTSLLPRCYKTVCIFMHTQVIGDGIIMSGFIKNLQDCGINVYVIAPARVSFLFHDIIGVDAFFSYEKNKIKELEGQLKNLKIDLVIDFSNFDHAAIVRLEHLFLIKPQHAICFNHPNTTIFDTNLIDNRSVHFSERMKLVLSLLGIERNSYAPALYFDSEKYEWADFVAKHVRQEGKKIVIFNPYGSQKSRTLSDGQVNSILSYLNELDGYHTIVFNMGKQLNLSALKNVSSSPFSDAGSSFALVRYAEFVVTVDTAIVHLASAFNIKQYCIYNNRMYDGRYENNIVWGPDSKSATQLTTSEYLRTESGDDMHKFDVDLLIQSIENDLKKDRSDKKEMQVGCNA